MKNVVSINGRKFLGSYMDARNNEQFPDEVPFAIGVILTMALPQLICGAYGLLPPVAFAGAALTGTIWGVANYFRQPSRTFSLADTRTVSENEKSRTVGKNAA